MNCQQCQDVLDNLLVAEPNTAERAALAEHMEKCPDCARQYARARQTLATITPTGQFPVSPDLKDRIMAALSDARGFQPAPAAVQVRRFRGWKAIAALATAVALLMVLASFLRPSPDQGGNKGVSAFGLLVQACAAEEHLFAGNQIVHLVNEIIVEPVTDATLAKIRWVPLVSLTATGKSDCDQLALPAKVGEGYTVEDECWYDPATGRFARVLASGGKPIFANSYDGKNVYTLKTPATGQPKVIRHPTTKDSQAPKSPGEFLGMAAGLRSSVSEKNESLATDVGRTTLADGVEARLVKLHLPTGGPEEIDKNYLLITIRSDNNVLERSEWLVQGKSLLVLRRGKAGPSQAPRMGWDLAGLVKPTATTTTAPGPSVTFGMVVPDVTVEHMVKKADFPTYVFSKAPSWAGERQITDILDLPSPPHRMFLITYRAKDGRHVGLMQSFGFNRAAGEMVKTGKVVYTSRGRIKVWSGPRDEWLAKVLLTSARASIKDPPGKKVTGYVLETPSGTFPVLAVNGKINEKELHWLIDNLVPAK
jgi:hypothetical protein